MYTTVTQRAVYAAAGVSFIDHLITEPRRPCACHYLVEPDSVCRQRIAPVEAVKRHGAVVGYVPEIIPLRQILNTAKNDLFYLFFLMAILSADPVRIGPGGKKRKSKLRWIRADIAKEFGGTNG